MPDAESFNFKVGTLNGDAERPKKITSSNKFNNVNLDDILFFINNLNLSDKDKQILIKVAKKTPHGSLSNFKKNYMCYVKNRA